MPESQANLAEHTNIAIPISWQFIGLLFLVSLLSALVFLTLASYSRVETALGAVTPDKGISNILPTRTGTVVELAVTEGQRVEAGDLLAQIRTEEDSGQGLSSAQQIEQAIARQDASLASQIDAANAAASAQQSQLAAQQAGLRSEIGQIQSQITIQQNLIETAQADLDRALEVAERGFISQRDLQVREETLLARQQGHSQFNQSLSTKRAALVQLFGRTHLSIGRIIGGTGNNRLLRSFIHPVRQIGFLARTLQQSINTSLHSITGAINPAYSPSQKTWKRRCAMNRREGLLPFSKVFYFRLTPFRHPSGMSSQCLLAPVLPMPPAWPARALSKAIENSYISFMLSPFQEAL